MSKRSKSKSVSTNPIFTIISGAIALFAGISQWMASFVGENKTTLLGMNGEVVSSYIFFNIASVMSIIAFCLFVYQMYMYYSGKNAFAEVVFEAGRWSEKFAKIKIKNNEPVGITDLSAKILAFSYNNIISSDLYSGYILKTTFPNRVITQDEFVFGEVNQDSYLQIKFHDFTFTQPLGNPKKKSDRKTAKCKVAIEFFGRLEDEKEIISLGQYYFEILQERFFDGDTWKNAIGCENFKSLNKKDSKDLDKLVMVRPNVSHT